MGNEMIKLFIISVLFFKLSAVSNYSCIEKMDELKQLKVAKVSLTEDILAYMFSGGMIELPKTEDEKILVQKISILEMELKLCRSENE